MIKEDSADMPDPPPTAAAKMPEQPPAGEHKVKKYHNTPQISITDTHGGHHIVVEEEEEEEETSTEEEEEGEEEMEEDDQDAVLQQQQQQQQLLQQQLLQQQIQQQQFLQQQQQQQQQMWQQMLLQYNAAAAAAGNTHKQYGAPDAGGSYPLSQLYQQMDVVGGDGSLKSAAGSSFQPPVSTAPTGSPASNGFHDLCIGLKRTMSDILSEIKNVLDRKQSEVIYQQAEDNRLLLGNTHVQMELQFLPAHGITENRLKFRRISGDSSSYNQLCQELLTGMNL